MPQTPNQQVKRQHLDRIRTLMRLHTTATRAELSRMTGLSVVTLGALLTQLEREGEVYSDGLLSSEGGRPACVYRFNADHRHALALCIVQREQDYELLVSTVDLQGRVLLSQSMALGADPLGTVLEAARRARREDPLVASVAAGIPGQAVEGTIRLCDVPALTGVRLADLLSSQTGVPALVENDMNAAVYGYALQAPPGEGCTAGVYFANRQGPGAGVLIDGRPVRGLCGMAGELGFLPLGVDWRDPPAPFESAVSDCLQALTAVLAPAQIILYCEGFDLMALEKLMRERWPAAMPRPRITLRQSVVPDYEAGVRRLALEPLWPAIQ